jgi:hypothetical protein
MMPLTVVRMWYNALTRVSPQDPNVDSEGQDRDSLELPGVQAELAMAVAEAAASPIIVVLVNGCPLAIQELKESTQVTEGEHADLSPPPSHILLIFRLLARLLAYSRTVQLCYTPMTLPC